jgi:S-disulfanyl-L-cysteine oxidoreductase SoxD
MRGHRKRRIGGTACLVLFTAIVSDAVEGPKLGRPATTAEIKAVDLSIPPDGSGLPPGQGSVQQGEAVYLRECASCHGEKGAGRTNDRLVGGFGTLTSDQPLKTVGSYWQWPTTLFDYTRRAMPYGAPLSLSNDDAYGVTAYLLHLNGIISDTAVMNAETLPRVKMPNQDNFINAYPQRPR